MGVEVTLIGNYGLEPAAEVSQSCPHKLADFVRGLRIFGKSSKPTIRVPISVEG